MTAEHTIFLDSLYGNIAFDSDMSGLLQTPVIQRLRHVRLSNIDSTMMPGIASLSRFEHVLGVAHLANNVGFFHKLSRDEQLVFQASALMHDWAITAFGHLVEEAFAYVGAQFDHEDKLHQIVMNEDTSEIGGVDMQIFCGRETGLKKWANKCFGDQKTDAQLLEITQCIRGQGRFGRVVCGDIDLDNIDNVFRMAFHMGLQVDRAIPLRLAKAIVGVQNNGAPIFLRNSENDIGNWLEIRGQVYERLMLAESDFSAKLMVLYSSVLAYKKHELDKANWNLTDQEFIQLLKHSEDKDCVETVKRWLVGEYWNITPLVWMSGKRPNFKEVLLFSEKLSADLDRTCFAYCIKDKRDRFLEINFDDGTVIPVGKQSNQWLLGIGTSRKSPFTKAEIATIHSRSEEFFKESVLMIAHSNAFLDNGQGSEQLCLL